jgi:hypothetical protein
MKNFGQFVNESKKNHKAQSINEAKKNIENSVSDLYAFAGVKTKYDERHVERYGQEVVDKAIEMAPSILAYKKKIKEMAKEVSKSPEGKLLMKVISNSKGYGGEHYTGVTVGELFDIYAS